MYLHLVRYDGEKWMGSCEVRAGETYPIGFDLESVREDGTAFGFEPIEFTPLLPWLNSALKDMASTRGEDFEPQPGYYRLYAPHLHFAESLDMEEVTTP